MNPEIHFHIINEIKETLKNSNKIFEIEIAAYFTEKKNRSDRNETDVNNLYIQINLNKRAQSKRVQCVYFYLFHNR